MVRLEVGEQCLIPKPELTSHVYTDQIDAYEATSLDLPGLGIFNVNMLANDFAGLESNHAMLLRLVKSGQKNGPPNGDDVVNLSVNLAFSNSTKRIAVSG